MQEVKWTDEQKKAIVTRNRNLLVSAAAGSGKTAVLVERIIEMITNADNPVDIDTVLVVTFTNAAASEMRERIGDAIEKKLEEQPENRFLHKQLTLLPNSNIMTIHAFCLMVIKNHFHDIQLDPSFRVAEESELTLLKGDILKELLEEAYAKEHNDSFLALVESYTSGKSDEQLEALILSIHRFAVSYPFPQEWLDKQSQALNLTEQTEMDHTLWAEIVVNHIRDILPIYKQMLHEAIGYCEEDHGPKHYEESIQSDLKWLSKCSQHQSFEALSEAFRTVSFAKLGGKGKEVEAALKEKVKGIRDEVKKGIRKLSETYFFKSTESMKKDIMCTASIIQTLVELVKDFMIKYQEAKTEKNMIDFNDIEHYALQILITRDERSSLIPTQAALEYQNKFEEVLIDEYQDSNLIQEYILTYVSKNKHSVCRPNQFMVGDVKQSIYKFRLAKPELFMNKYNSYTIEDSSYQKILLHKNFRSRKEILEGVNFIFRQLMSEQVGDVIYDDACALNLGANYEPDESAYGETKLVLVDKDKDISEELDVSSKQLEAMWVARKIHKMVQSHTPTLIYDKNEKKYRPMMYKDIVVLLRTTTKWAEVFIEELAKKGIPAYTDVKSGYFDTVEVKTIIHLLKIIDNPRQDIALLTVLKSPIVDLNAEELVQIKSTFKESEFYDAYLCYLEGDLEDSLWNKLNAFNEKLLRWRDRAAYTPLHDLLWQLYEETNYYHYVSVMPGGIRRQANLDLLIDKAVHYEASSYKGLFNFIRYIEKIKKYAIDFGEAAIYGENENLVRVMSIHKSKGLEFPVVFVAGLGKSFNFQDLNSKILLHQDYGFGASYVNYKMRYETNTLPKAVIRLKSKIELLSEELRILYVALTRAREKLYLIGCVEELDKKIENWCQHIHRNTLRLPYTTLIGGTTYLHWIVPALVLQDNPSFWKIEKESGKQLIDADDKLSDKQLKIGDNLLHWDIEKNYFHKEAIHKLLTYQYPKHDIVSKPVKVTVSDLKKYHSDEDTAFLLKTVNQSPRFISETVELSPTQKGTLYHQIMQHLDFQKSTDRNTFNTFLETLIKRSMITSKELQAIDQQLIFAFLKTSLFQRMKKADACGLLKKEIPFVIGIKGKELYEELVEHFDDLILVQGVIDCYFEEEGEIVLVDYKTDFVKDEEILIKRYNKQMLFYKRAIEQITGKKVKERILYALTMGQEIKL